MDVIWAFRLALNQLASAEMKTPSQQDVTRQREKGLTVQETRLEA